MRGSETSRALFSEQKIAAALRRLDWKVTHGAYYPDPVTGKERELDVVAVRYFTKPDGEAVSVRLHLLVECKSIKTGTAPSPLPSR